MHDPNIDQAILMTIISKQNTQIELLFDMIRNIPGNERFFEKEFISEMACTYELINEIKKKMNIK